MDSMEQQNQLAAHQMEMQDTLSPEEEFDRFFDELDKGSGSDVPPPPDEQGPSEDSKQEPPSHEETPESKLADQLEEKGDEKGADDQRYNSMMGRLKASQQENSRLKSQFSDMENRIRELQNQLAARQEPPAQPVPVEGAEDLQDDVRALVQEQSSDGEKMRRVLEEYGPEHVSVLAQAVLARRETQNATAQMRQQFDVDARERHNMALAEAHPEFADAILGRDAAKTAELQNGILAWIGQLPYAEGAEMQRILGNGTTYEVSAMLAKYRQFRTGSSKPRDSVQPQSGQAHRLAQSNIAVPSMGSRVPTKAKATSFDDVWDELDKK